MTTSSSARSALQIAFLASAARPYARASSTEICMHCERSFTSAIAISTTRRGEAKAQEQRSVASLLIFAPSLMKGNPNSHSPSSALFSALFSGICTTLWRVEVQSALWFTLGRDGRGMFRTACNIHTVDCFPKIPKQSDNNSTLAQNHYWKNV